MTRAKTPGGRGTVARLPQVTSRRRQVAQVMHRLGAAMRPMAEPAVEKIAAKEHSDPFKVLVATMLSAQTRDPVTFEASKWSSTT